MLKWLSQTISVLMHPLLMPTVGLFLIFYAGNSIFLLPFQAKKIIILIVSINTLLLPLLIIPLFYRMNIIKSLQMHSHKERIAPLSFTLIPYIFSYYFLSQLPIFNEFSLFILGATLAVAIALVVSIWWKISIHMIGIGGIAGLVFAMSYRFYFEVFWLFGLIIIAAGLLAWARLYLDSHKPSQIYTGFIVGLFTVFLSIINL